MHYHLKHHPWQLLRLSQSHVPVPLLTGVYAVVLPRRCMCADYFRYVASHCRRSSSVHMMRILFIQFCY